MIIRKKYMKSEENEKKERKMGDGRHYLIMQTK